MNWERDAETREAQAGSIPPYDTAQTLSYLMLKPDGNRPEVIQHVEQVFRQNRFWVSMLPIRFTFEEAYAFYPKDTAWKKKYGQKRLDVLLKAGHLPNPPSAEVMGEEILHNMADYLSSSPCRMFLFIAQDAVNFGKKLVGDTVPDQAHDLSLRGKFSKDNLERSALERRALHNVAHAPDKENVTEELLYLSRLQSMSEIDRAQMVRTIAQSSDQLSLL